MNDKTGKVLIVDDEIDICYLLSVILKQRNLVPKYVNTLMDAELALKKEAPSILFLDNHLPDGLGVDFIKHVKKNYPSIKIILITAYDSPVEKQTALREGADYFIGKPFTKSIINTTVDMVISKQ
jgi:two-component system OmpR family response regulator